MPPTDEIKIIKSGPSLSGANLKPTADIHPINIFTALQ